VLSEKRPAPVRRGGPFPRPHHLRSLGPVLTLGIVASTWAGLPRDQRDAPSGDSGLLGLGRAWLNGERIMSRLLRGLRVLVPAASVHSGASCARLLPFDVGQLVLVDFAPPRIRRNLFNINGSRGMSP